MAAPWVKCWWDWFTSRSHKGVGFDALHLGAGFLKQIAKASPEEGWLLGPDGMPVKWADYAKDAQASPRRIEKAIQRLVEVGTLIRREDGAVGFNPETWAKRQSTSKNRVAKHREKRRCNAPGNADVTHPVTQKKQTEDRRQKTEDRPQRGEGKRAVRARRQAATPSLADVVDAWNALATRRGLALVEDQTDDRRNKVRTRSRKSDRLNTLDGWKIYFDRIGSSSFCCGENERGWRLDFDFAIHSDGNVAKVFEGKYDDRERKSGGPKSLSVDDILAHCDPPIEPCQPAQDPLILIGEVTDR